ncbi:hypothetical protein [Nocardia bovistercoris]|uniref:Uncharacterized protein n=1 Tax=Nocardia bovistercoris TaxID=2785916 RepID=A0A931I9D8_9NOCA|nr:hypothetical protein [Nocardia bovistercoris]MBH0776132.1 hypothetical protein [Nocardia bovistercoris]
MPKKIGGKIFYTAEETEQLGLRPSAEEIARTEQMFAEWEERKRAAGPAPEGTIPAGFGGRFSDDLAGTEYEGWTRDPGTNQWYDKEGRPVYYDQNRGCYLDESGRQIDSKR